MPTKGKEEYIKQETNNEMNWGRLLGRAGKGAVGGCPKEGRRLLQDKDASKTSTYK